MLLKFASCLCGCYRACYISCNAAVFPNQGVRSFASNTLSHACRKNSAAAPCNHADFFKESVPRD